MRPMEVPSWDGLPHRQQADFNMPNIIQVHVRFGGGDAGRGANADTCVLHGRRGGDIEIGYAVSIFFTAFAWFSVIEK